MDARGTPNWAAPELDNVWPACLLGIAPFVITCFALLIRPSPRAAKIALRMISRIALMTIFSQAHGALAYALAYATFTSANDMPKSAFRLSRSRNDKSFRLYKICWKLGTRSQSQVTKL